MRASELIGRLIGAIAQNGDLEVIAEYDPIYERCVNDLDVRETTKPYGNNDLKIILKFD